MEFSIKVVQLVVGLSVLFVWFFRYNNVVTDFNQFGLNNITRRLVGLAKVTLAVLLIAGVWYPSLVLISAIGMGLFMVAAQYFHYKIKNSFTKHLPSLFLLILCAFIAIGSLQII